MASGSAPNHDFAPAWLRLPTTVQRPSGDSLTRRDGAPNSQSAVSASSKNTLSQEQRRDRGRAAFPFRHHSIDADDLQHRHQQQGTSGSGTNGDYRLHAGQRQQSGSQPTLGGGSVSGSRRPLSRQDFRDGSKGFGSGGSGYEQHNGSSDHHYRGDVHWGRQRSFDRAGRGNTSDLNGGSSRGNGGGRNGGSGATASKWNDDTIDKFDKEFPSLKGESFESSGGTAVTSVSSVWGLDKSKSGKIHLSTSSSGKRLHQVKKPERNETAPDVLTAAAAKQSSTTSPGGNTTTVTNNGSTSVYRTLGSTKGPMLRRPSKDSGKLNGLPTKSLSLAANKSEFLRELRDETPADAVVAASDGLCNGHDYCSSDEDGGAGGDAVSSADSTSPAADGSCAEVMVNGIEEDQPTRSRDTLAHTQFVAVNGVGIRGAASDQQPDNETLSRSLEAEQRLLRAMGWKEEDSGDEDVYRPITEDERREFESMSKKIPKRNGFQRNVQFMWSPKRMLPIPSALHLESEGSSTSTSSDSDSD